MQKFPRGEASIKYDKSFNIRPYGLDLSFCFIFQNAFQSMLLTESDGFLREEGPFVSWPPSLLEDLLEEVLNSSTFTQSRYLGTFPLCQIKPFLW